MKAVCDARPDLTGSSADMKEFTSIVGRLSTFAPPMTRTIEDFWKVEANKEMPGSSWKGHEDINTVMLATSLAPEGFLHFFWESCKTK